MIRLGYARQSAPSAHRIAEASDGRIKAVRRGPCEINWGRRRSRSARLNADVTSAANKRVARELFAEHAVPAPALFSREEGLYFMWEPEAARVWTLVGRPDTHTRMQGFWVCDTHEKAVAAVNADRRAATHFIRYVDLTEASKEFRVHVFRGQSIRISRKFEDESDDPRRYTTRKPDPDLPKRFIRNAAKAAVAAVGVDFGTVDVLASEDQRTVWVLEVNTAPGLGGSMPELWARTFINWHDEEGD